MNPGTMNQLAAVQQMVDATAPAENNPQIPTALGPQLQDPPMVTIARAAQAVAAAALARRWWRQGQQRRELITWRWQKSWWRR
jgi:hypothetical protein